MIIIKHSQWTNKLHSKRYCLIDTTFIIWSPLKSAKSLLKACINFQLSRRHWQYFIYFYSSWLERSQSMTYATTNPPNPFQNSTYDDQQCHDLLSTGKEQKFLQDLTVGFLNTCFKFESVERRKSGMEIFVLFSSFESREWIAHDFMQVIFQLGYVWVLNC